MPLVLPLALLVVVVAFGAVLGLVGLVRRPFRAPAWQPVFGWMLTLRAVLVTAGLAIALGVLAWRHPEAVGALGFGLAAGVVLGIGSATSAQLQAGARWTLHRPRRAFAALVALAVLGRAVASAADLVAGREPVGLLPMLGGLLGGYALAHAVVLRLRLRRFGRLRRAG